MAITRKNARVTSFNFIYNQDGLQSVSAHIAYELWEKGQQLESFGRWVNVAYSPHDHRQLTDLIESILKANP